MTDAQAHYSGRNGRRSSDRLCVVDGHVGRAKIASKEEATEASAPISPHEMMIKQGNILPVEYWSIRSEP